MPAGILVCTDWHIHTKPSFPGTPKPRGHSWHVVWHPAGLRPGWGAQVLGESGFNISISIISIIYIYIIIIIIRRSGITSHTSHGHKTGTRSMQPVRSVPLGGPVVS